MSTYEVDKVEAGYSYNLTSTVGFACFQIFYTARYDYPGSIYEIQMPYIKPYELNRHINKKAVGPVYILAGEETFQQQQAWKTMSSLLELNDFDFESFYGQDADINNLITALQTLPFTCEKRVVLVKDAHKIKSADAAKLAGFLKTPPASSCLVMVWPEKVRSDTKRLPLFKTVEKNGIIADFRALYENEIPSWIQNRLKENNKRIEYAAIQYLIQESGTNLTDLNNEIEKLALFTSGKQEITLDDVEILCGHTKQLNLNHLQNALEAKNVTEAIKITENLLREGEVPLRILSTIYRTIRKLLYAVSRKEEEGAGNEEIRGELKMHPYFAKAFFLNLAGFKHEKLVRDIEAISSSDRKIKTTSVPHNMIFEELIYELCK
jgi:DNA polymerase-3 subunit delta